MQIDFENPDFIRILDKTRFSNLWKIINLKRLSCQEKQNFKNYLEKRVLYEITIDIKKLSWLAQLLKKLEIEDDFLKTFIDDLNEFISSVPQIVLRCLNGREEADTKLCTQRPQDSIYLLGLFGSNKVNIREELRDLIPYAKSINIIIFKSWIKRFNNFMGLLEILKQNHFNNNWI